MCAAISILRERKVVLHAVTFLLYCLHRCKIKIFVLEFGKNFPSKQNFLRTSDFYVNGILDKSFQQGNFAVVHEADHNTSWSESKTLREGEHESPNYWSCGAPRCLLARPHDQRFGSYF